MNYSERAVAVARKVEDFVRSEIIPYEKDPRFYGDHHGPHEDLVMEMRAKARAAGVLTPHVLADGDHLSHLEMVPVLIASGLSPLGPLAVNTMAPDEGNMYLIGKVGTAEQKRQFLKPLHDGSARSSFFMTEPAEDQGAGADPSMMKTRAVQDGNHWVINGRKCFITGAQGAKMAIIMANSGTPEKMAATMFLVELPNPAIIIERIPDTIDSSMPGGHPTLRIENLRVSTDQVLGELHKGFEYAQVRLSPARLTHCMRWLGCCIRANEIASDYACRRMAFGKVLIEHEGVGFPLAENMIELKQAELMTAWCAQILDTGVLGTVESSMAKVAVSEALFRIADRCVQVMGGTGVTRDTVVEQIFREVRAFRIYDGPTEVHKWSLAKKIRRDHARAQTPAA